MPEIELSPILLVPGLTMILLSLIFVIGWRITERPPWLMFFWGALALVVSFLFLTLPEEVFGRGLLLRFLGGLPENAATISFFFYVALTVSLFECGVILLVARLSPAGRANWQKAVAFGIGMGAAGVFATGIIRTFTTLRDILSPELVPVDEVFSLQQIQSNFWMVYPPQMLEQIAGLVGAITAAVLVIYAYRAGAWLYLLAGIVYAMLVAGVPAWTFQILGNFDVTSLWIVMAAMAVLAIIGLLATALLRDRYQEIKEATEVEETPDEEAPADEPSSVEEIHSSDEPTAKDTL